MVTHNLQSLGVLMNHDTLYTPAEAAEILRVKKGQILKWINDGSISASRLSRRTILVRGADLDAFVESKRIPTAVHLAAGSTSPIDDEAEGDDDDGFLGVSDDE